MSTISTTSTIWVTITSMLRRKNPQFWRFWLRIFKSARHSKSSRNRNILKNGFWHRFATTGVAAPRWRSKRSQLVDVYKYYYRKVILKKRVTLPQTKTVGRCVLPQQTQTRGRRRHFRRKECHAGKNSRQRKQAIGTQQTSRSRDASSHHRPTSLATLVFLYGFNANY